VTPGGKNSSSAFWRVPVAADAAAGACPGLCGRVAVSAGEGWVACLPCFLGFSWGADA
jgi:hypothetical protein